MQGKAQLTAQDFTELLQAMRKSHERLVTERRVSWERRLDVLGEFLIEVEEESKSKEDLK
ncbi:hypothetical protein D3C71_1506780 [compost metagenome]